MILYDPRTYSLSSPICDLDRSIAVIHTTAYQSLNAPNTELGLRLRLWSHYLTGHPAIFNGTPPTTTCNTTDIAVFTTINTYIFRSERMNMTTQERE